jgi:hypothetical protein
MWAAAGAYLIASLTENHAMKDDNLRLCSITVKNYGNSSSDEIMVITYAFFVEY